MPCVKDDPPTKENPVVLLLNGHKTRFSLVVLGWCRANHVIIFLGVPNSTHVWQFSDSSALNGGFKIFWNSAKVRVFPFQLRCHAFSVDPSPTSLPSSSPQRKWIKMKSCATVEAVPIKERMKIQSPDIAILFNEVLPLTFGDEAKRNGVIRPDKKRCN